MDNGLYVGIIYSCANHVLLLQLL